MGNDVIRKFLILLLILINFLVMGCTPTKETINEKQSVNYVYCVSCAAESKEVTKFCSNCGIEAKWLIEKPKVSEEKKGEEISNNESEEVKTEMKNVNDEKINITNEEYNICWVCRKKDKISNLEHIHGLGCYVHIKCYENYPNCKICDNKLVGVDEDRDNICDTCENNVCTVCGKYYKDVFKLYGGVCNNCQWNEAYKDKAACNSCSEIVDKSLAGQKCKSCGEGVYELLVK